MPPSIAVCQEWVMTWSGSEQVASHLAAATGAKDVFTYAARPDLIEVVFPGRNVTTSRLGRTRFAQRRWSWLLPDMARWWRTLDLDAYDVVLTCSHATVNAVRPRPDALLVSYCCTPMRYAWTWRTEIDRVPGPLRSVWPAVAAMLRRSDRRRAQRVDLFLAVSACVADRIRAAYGRRSLVVYPPVDTDHFTPDDEHAPSGQRDDYLLFAGRLVPYKRADVAVEAARLTGARLVIAGSGPELQRLQESAPANVEFRVQPTNDELRTLYRRARALVFPGEEDFGMVMVEAQACGTPVIALRAGGAIEAVRDGITGALYDDPSPAGLADAIRRFDPEPFAPGDLRRHAERFSADRFDATVASIVERLTAAPVTELDAVIASMLDGDENARQ